MNVAIIPARGGSKRIPNKNINNFNGKPIISWSIKCAFKTKLFDRIIVSTDNQEIAKTAKQYGAEVPFIRPKNLSNDSVGIIEVISHATRWMLKNGIEPKYICCLLATAPLMQPQDIYMAYKKLINEKRTYVFAASTFPSSIYRSLFFDKTEGNLRICFPGKFKKNINNFTEVFYDVGQFYWGKKETWLQKKMFLAPIRQL